MGLFNKKESASKSPSPAPPSPTEDGQPKGRQPYVPRHAARDGMIGAPTGWNSAEQNVVRQENRRRDLERQAGAFASSSSSSSTGGGGYDARSSPPPTFPSPAMASRQLSEMSLDSKLAAAATADFSRTSSYLSVNSEASSSRLSGGEWSETNNNNNGPRLARNYFSHGMDKPHLRRSPLSTPATSVDLTPDTSESGSIESGLPQMRPTAPHAYSSTTRRPASSEKPPAAAAAEKSKGKWMKRMTRSSSPEEAT